MVILETLAVEGVIGMLIDSELKTLNFFVPGHSGRFDEPAVPRMYVESAPIPGFSKTLVTLRSPMEAALANAFEESSSRSDEPLLAWSLPGQMALARSIRMKRLGELATWLRTRTDDGQSR